MDFSLTDSAASLTVSDGTHTVVVPGPRPEPAVNRPLDEAAAAKNLTKTGGTPYCIDAFRADLAPGLTLPAAALNALRREALETLDDRRGAVPPWSPGSYKPAPSVPPREHSPTPLWARFYRAAQLAGAEHLEKVILPVSELTPELIQTLGDKLVGELPAVCFPEDEDTLTARLEALRDAGLPALWTENIYGIALGRRLGLPVRSGFGLNVANTRAAAFYAAQGLQSLTISFELPMSAVKRLGAELPLGIAAYGRLPLMRFRNCPVRAQIGCAACQGAGELTDRKGVRFPVECGGRRFSTLLNSVPLNISGRDDPLDFRLLWFTRETAAECAEVIDIFRRDLRPDAPHTGGLYYRKLL